MFLTLPMGGPLASFRHGTREIWGVEVLRRAFASAGLSQKQAAYALELTEPQLSRQMKCEDGAHVSYQRLFRLPAKVIAEIGRELFEAFSGGGVCVEHEQIQRLLTANQRIAEALEARDSERRIA